jgi:hypothetical protein
MAAPAAAQSEAALRSASVCVTLPSNTPRPDHPLRVTGSQDIVHRQLLGPRDLLVIDGGTERGVQLDQLFVVRRLAQGHAPSLQERGIVTAGTVRIVAVNEAMALATLETVCDAVYVGDFLQPWGDPPPADDRLPSEIDLDFSSPARMVFGPYERRMASVGEVVVTDAGEAKGVAAGDRFAIYRDVQRPGVPLFAIGEATVESVAPDSSLVRIVRSRTSVTSDDLFVPRRPIQ